MSKVGWVVLVVLAANTLGGAWWAWKRYALSKAIDTTVEGTVVVSEVKGTGRTTRYQFVVEYHHGRQRYTVSAGPDADASDRIAAHPVGSKVPVYLDASNPSLATLRPSAGYVFWMVLAAGLLASTIGAAYYFLSKKT